jgi:hypothetical protein
MLRPYISPAEMRVQRVGLMPLVDPLGAVDVVGHR